MIFKSGLIAATPDYRDWRVGNLYSLPSELPLYHNMDHLLPKVRDQGKFGTCVAFAGVCIKGIQEALNYPGADYEFSPLHLYSEAKEIDGYKDSEGTTLKAVMSVLKNRGICFEGSFPYSLMSWPELPKMNDSLREEGLKFVIGGYALAQTEQEIKFQLSCNQPVLGGILVTESFVEGVDGEGYVPIPRGTYLGGHGIAVIGYDDTREKNGHVGFFRVQNSWGSSWGDKGRCWIPYDYFRMVDKDLGYRYWPESMSSVDLILPIQQANKIVFFVGSKDVEIDGRKWTMHTKLKIDSETNRVMVPLRAIGEMLGYKVFWENGKILMMRGG